MLASHTAEDSTGGREVASIAYTDGAKTEAVLMVLQHLGIGPSVPGIVTNLEDGGVLAGLPDYRSSGDPDFSAGGLQIWVLSRTK